MSACGGNTNDLRAWVDTIKAKPPGRIKPMPEVKEYKPHDYQSAHLKSPFSELEPELESQLQALVDGCDESIRPDTSRRKEDLERYSLDSMEMVGIVNNNQKQWGLVRMTAGPAKDNVFHVTVGNYLGINHGQIMKIEEQQIEITTLVPDSKGCWEQRTVYMALAQ
ncbi:pilus assembly protein PilP [Aliikangiella marina]|uniref:pilus assembly protein PilP n=1 Tax=Aliikangiella marina TaxID=1712262 RepID=UPI00163D48FC|nr:pilus assembly protein PilP [Aliikangiella marina]